MSEEEIAAPMKPVGVVGRVRDTSFGSSTPSTLFATVLNSSTVGENAGNPARPWNWKEPNSSKPMSGLDESTLTKRIRVGSA